MSAIDTLLDDTWECLCDELGRPPYQWEWQERIDLILANSLDLEDDCNA